MAEHTLGGERLVDGENGKIGEVILGYCSSLALYLLRLWSSRNSTLQHNFRTLSMLTALLHLLPERCILKFRRLT